ncbi:MAG: DsbA family oxidoreductase, partial [Boseongicola sp.]
FEGIKRTPNTLDAHRLIHWAGLEGRQTAVVSRLFKAYFEEGKDIGDRTLLLDMAEGVGLDRAMTERLIESDADLDEIRARDIHARNRGVTGVPTFVVANQHVVPGAQLPELWLRVIDELVEHAEAPEA